MAATTRKRMRVLNRRHILKYLSRIMLLGATFITLALVQARAAELVMFERAGCEWCEVFNRDVAPVYAKTAEGARAPLRRVDIGAALPPDLAFLSVERLTPLFVLVDQGREIGRIRGYPGDDHFWGLLGALIRKLDAPPATGEQQLRQEKALRGLT
jgi:hypothetical protein